MRRAVDTANVFHEQLLRQSIGFAHEGIVVSLSDFTDLVESSVAQGFSGFAERLESVLRLTRHNDVLNESQKIVFTRCIGEVSNESSRSPDRLLHHSRFGTKRGLILLEHPLVLAHVRNVPRAEIPEAYIVGLLLVLLDGTEHCLVLHDGVVDLRFKKVESELHHRLLREHVGTQHISETCARNRLHWWNKNANFEYPNMCRSRGA